MNEGFNRLVDSAIEENLKNRKHYPVSNFTDIGHLIHMCTVKLSLGRGIGKTSYIAEHATEKDLIVVGTMLHRRMMLEKNPVAKVFTYDMIYREPKESFENIYVDEPSAVFAGKDIYNFYYNLLNSDVEQIFIFLGE